MNSLSRSSSSSTDAATSGNRVNWLANRKAISLRGVALVTALIVAGANAGAQRTERQEADVFAPQLRVGQQISNVFSISQSVKAEGYDEIVSRNGGSGDYVTTRTGADEHRFDAQFRYDGSATSRGLVAISAGGRTTCWNDSCQPATDASGPLFNHRMWGVPPRDPQRGITWRAPINVPWEMAGSGNQTVTVMDVDRTNDCVTLKREGTSDRPAMSERTTLKLTKNGKATEFSVAAGRSSWKGLATFCRGLVMSDELLVDRTDILSSREVGSVAAKRRSIMLLNAAPYPTL